MDNYITRLRLEVKDVSIINEKQIISSGVHGVKKVGKDSVQVVVGTTEQL